MKLQDVLDSHRVVVCVGSGGVGKTTTSAAIALRSALAGKRALCLTIDPAKRLANSLGLSELNRQEQRIDPALFAESGLQCDGQLSAMMLDMKHTFDELVTRHAGSEAQAQRILDNRLYQYVSTSLAGTQEYMAMERLHEVHRDDAHDYVVLDTPPTTNALDFLDAPQRLINAIDSPVMSWFVETLEQNKGVSLVGRGAAYVLRGLSKFTGSDFLEQVGEFVSELNALFGGFRDRAASVYEDLRGDDVAFVIVTSPHPLAVAEAVYFAKKLAEYRIEPKAIIVNRVHGPAQVSLDDDGLQQALTQALPDLPDAQGLLQRMGTAAAHAHGLYERDQEGLRRLRDYLPDTLTYTEIPAFETDVHDLHGLAKLGAHFVV